MKCLLVFAVLVAAAVAQEEKESGPNPTAAADPYLFYSGLGYAGYAPYGYGYAYHHPYAGCRNVAGALVPCAGKKKREAEAEADPYLLYSHLGYAGYAHAAPYYYGYHPYAGCRNDAGALVPCAGKKKREAEAEADPALLYSGLGYYPYAYGAHAYGYAPYAHLSGCRNYLGALVPC